MNIVSELLAQSYAESDLILPGESVGEDVLDRIFSEFCVGK